MTVAGGQPNARAIHKTALGDTANNKGGKTTHTQPSTDDHRTKFKREREGGERENERGEFGSRPTRLQNQILTRSGR